MWRNELQNSPGFFSPGHYSPDITLQQKIFPEQNSPGTNISRDTTLQQELRTLPGHYSPETKFSSTLFSRGQNSPGTKLSGYKFLPVHNCPGRKTSRDKTLPFQNKYIVQIGNFYIVTKLSHMVKVVKLCMVQNSPR